MMTLTLVLSLFGCGKKNTAAGGSGNADADNVNVVTDNISDGSAQDAEKKNNEWGVRGFHTTSTKDYKFQGMYINYPKLIGVSEGTGQIAYQDDGTFIIVDGQTVSSPDVKDGKLENVLTAYFEQTVDIIKGYKSFTYDNFELNIKSQKKTKVGDYDMCRFTGTITSENNGEKYENFFTAYSTKLKGNDTFAYWMVLDDTEKQSMKKTVEEYADKMSETLVED